MRRLVELGTIGGVIAAAWMAAAWAAGTGEALSYGGWAAVAAALAVSYGGLVECAVRVAARAEWESEARERGEDGGE